MSIPVLSRTDSPSGQRTERGGVYTWPAADAAGVLKSDGSGNLSLAALVGADLPAISSFHAKSSAATSFTGAANTQAVFATSIHNDGSNYSTATSTYTAPRAGYYWAGGIVTLDNAAGAGDGNMLALQLWKNGAFFQTLARLVEAKNSQYHGPSGGIVVKLAASDTLKLYVFSEITRTQFASADHNAFAVTEVR